MGAGVEIAMKTPSLPLLALAAALSSNAAADDSPARRCAADWMTKASAAVSAGTTLPADDKAMMSVAVTGGAPLLVVDLDSKAFPCDSPLKHHLVVAVPLADPTPRTGLAGVPTQLKWNDEALSTAWHKNFANQVGILAAVDEMYSFVDSRGLVAVKAADDVVDAAVALGVAAKTVDAAGLAAVKKVDYTGDSFAGVPVYSVAASAAASAAKPDELKAALGKLLKDKKSPDGKTSTVVVGPAVLTFRKAIIDLADEVAVRASGRELLAKRGVDGAAKFDFVPAAGVAAFKALGAVKDAAASPKIPDAVAEKDENYTKALAYLVGTDPIKEGSDTSTHDSATLSRFDYGLRNLIATRAAAVDAAVDAAKKKIGTGTVKAALGAVDRDAKAPAAPTAGTPDLAAGVLAKLNANPDFAKLNKIFENADNNKADPNSPDAKWAATPEGIAARAQRDQMIANAKATKIADGQLVYRVGTTNPTDLSSFVKVPGLANASYRGAIEDAVLVKILEGSPIDAKWAAAVEALKGHAPIPDQVPPGAKVPPQTDPATPPAKSAWQTILQATPDPHWWHGNADSYLMDETTRAAEAADASRRHRKQVTDLANAKRDAAQRTCDDAKAEIAARPADPLLKPAAAKQWRDALMAQKVAECDGATGSIQSAYDTVMKDARANDPLIDPVVTPKDGGKPVDPIVQAQQDRLAAADKLIRQAYIDGIKESIDELHKEYRNPKNDRAQKAADESGFGGFYGAHLDLVDGYFTKNWDGGALPTSTKSCSDILWHQASGDRKHRVSAKFEDPNVDNVDGMCVHVGLVTHLKGYIGTGDLPK